MALLHVMPFGHMAINAASTILAATTGLESISGYSAESLVGRPLHLLIPSTTSHPHFQSLETYSKGYGEKPLNTLSDVPLLRKDGKIVRVSVERYVYSYADELRFGGVVRLLPGQEAIINALPV